MKAPRSWFRNVRRSCVTATSGAVLAAIAIAACSGSNDGAGAPATTSPSGDAGDASRAIDGAADGVAPPAPLPTGQFRIGVWCGLPAAELTKARMDEMATAGFTTTSYGCEGDTSSAAYNTSMLALAKADGMDAIVYDPRIAAAVAGTDVAANLDGVVNDFAKTPGLAGYFVADEPTAPFTSLAGVVDGLQTRDPDHFAYVNLLPVYASAAQLGTASYDDYVGSYFSTAKPKVISFDDYPFLTNGNNTTFFTDLSTMRTHAVAANVPFWQFLQSISFSGHRTTTAAEKLWEGTQTLAYGGAGISYFCYWTPPPSGESFGDALIDSAGNETPQYAEAKTVNARLQAFGRYLVAAKSTSVFHDGALPAGGVPRVPNAAVYVPNALPLTVGLFSVNDGAYAFVANGDTTNAIDSDIFLASAAPPEVLDVASGKFTAVSMLTKDAEKGFKTHVSLAAGDATLFHLWGPVPAGAPGAEAFVGTVRSDVGTLDVVDSSFGDGAFEAAGWNTCPEGYDFAGRDFESNGFWLCTRHDLASHTFYVGNVVADQAIVYSVAGGTATAGAAAGWDTCPKGTLLGRRFESNGYWLCME